MLLRGTSREELILKPISLIAIITLCSRPLLDGDFPRNILAQFLIEIMSVPALVYHLHKHTNQCIEQLSSMWILKRAVSILEDINWFSDFGQQLTSTRCLAFLGNIMNLFYVENITEAQLLAYPLLTVIMIDHL